MRNDNLQSTKEDIEKINTELEFTQIKNKLMIVDCLGAITIALAVIIMYDFQFKIFGIKKIVENHFPDEVAQSEFLKKTDIFGFVSVGNVLLIFLGIFFVYACIKMIQLRKKTSKNAILIKDLKDKIAQLEKSHPISLPAELDSPRAQKYLKRAIDKGLLISTINGLKRVNNLCTKAQFAYLLRIIYCPNLTEPLPAKNIDVYFSESRMQEAIRKLYKNKDNKPAHPEIIDSLLDD